MTFQEEVNAIKMILDKLQRELNEVSATLASVDASLTILEQSLTATKGGCHV
jgi:prefoldin subunit 5